MTPINPSENFTPENNNIINKTTVVLGITNRTGSMITRIFHNDKLAEKAYYMLMARRIELGHNQKNIGDQPNQGEKQLIKQIENDPEYILIDYKDDPYNSIPIIGITEDKALKLAESCYRRENEGYPIYPKIQEKTNHKFLFAIPVSYKYWTFISYDSKTYHLQDIDLFKDPFQTEFKPNITKIINTTPNFISL